jgi:HlyD family secretion protein
MKKQHVLVIALIAIFCIPIFMKIARPAAALTVDVENIAYRDIRSSVLASGHLFYDEQVVLSPEVIGKVSTIFAKEGQKVIKNDLLLHLDDQSYRAEVSQQEAAVKQQSINIEQQQLNLANQESQLKRKEELHRVRMISDAAIEDGRFAVDGARIELRNSRSRLDQAEAILRQSKERLAKTSVRAPISGTITALHIKVGETAVASQVSIAGSSLMTIANTSTMMTEINVDEADIAKVALGQEVAIHTAAYPEFPIKGEVALIPLSPKQVQNTQPTGASLARSYSVKVKLSSIRKLTLRPGMTCRAEIYTASSGKALSLPLQAVLSNNDEGTELARKKFGRDKVQIKTEHWVYVNVNGKAEKRVVTLGASDDSQQEILTGVKAGEAVITGPYRILRHLKTGDTVVGNTATSVTVNATSSET